MKTYLVITPIAGHLTHEVEAENEAEAIEKSWMMNPDDGELTWECLESFGQGNVCSCPEPWEVETEEI